MFLVVFPDQKKGLSMPHALWRLAFTNAEQQTAPSGLETQGLVI